MVTAGLRPQRHLERAFKMKMIRYTSNSIKNAIFKIIGENFNSAGMDGRTLLRIEATNEEAKRLRASTINSYWLTVNSTHSTVVGWSSFEAEEPNDILKGRSTTQV